MRLYIRTYGHSCGCCHSNGSLQSLQSLQQFCGCCQCNSSLQSLQQFTVTAPSSHSSSSAVFFTATALQLQLKTNHFTINFYNFGNYFLKMLDVVTTFGNCYRCPKLQCCSLVVGLTSLLQKVMKKCALTFNHMYIKYVITSCKYYKYV